MADVAANLVISAKGADQASAALDSVSQGMASIGRQHGDLEAKFGHRFTHIGLQLFATDALRASGLGTEARQVIGTLQMAIMAAGSAFGAAAGPIMLVGAALAAGIGIFEKVTSKSGESAEGLKKLTDAQQKEREALETDIQRLQGYKEELGFLPPAIENLLQAKIRLYNFETQQEISSLEKQQKALTSLMDEEVKHGQELEAKAHIQKGLTDAEMQQLSAWQATKTALTSVTGLFSNYKKQLDENTSSYEKNRVELKKVEAELNLAKQGVANVEGSVKAMAEAHKQAAEDAKKAAEEEVKAIEHTNAVIESLTNKEKEYEVQAAGAHAQSISDKNKKTDEWYEYQLQKLEENYAKEENYIDKNIQDETTRYQKLAELHAQFDETQNALDDAYNAKRISADSRRDEQLKQMSGQMGDKLAGDIGNSFAKMIVEGKSFSESMTQAFTQLAEEIIADIIRIELEWAILMAMGFPAGGGAGGGLGAVFAAEGVSMAVNKPTVFVAGEGGQPEMVNITPFSKLGQNSSSDMSGGGTIINIGTVQTNVHGVQNPDQIADQVGDKIIQRIRGRGELNFARSA